MLPEAFDKQTQEWHTVIVPSWNGWRLFPAAQRGSKGESIMSLESHLAELQRRHGDLERKIDEALMHPSVDNLEIVELKRRKLAIKDEIERLRTQTAVSTTTH
jgi:hypothetical protein